MTQQAQFDFKKEVIIWDEVETKPVNTKCLQAAWWQMWTKENKEVKEYEYSGEDYPGVLGLRTRQYKRHW